MTEKIAVYGAAFNPPHAGHLDAIAQLLAQVDRVLVVPSYRHAFGKTMAPFAQRVAMVKAALASVSLPPTRVEVDLSEQRLAAAKAAEDPIYSWDLLQETQQRHPDARICLAIGPDNANPAQWQKFYRHEDIDARWQTLVVEERVNVRSSAVRDAIAAGASVPVALLPAEVAQLIDQFGLYR
ncbi:adenylyltransferase/cytidyltransferase family protein [Simiduia agarivorans]|uniref:nicotinate-nucleotide adenylyltransferase n=1 Tax=Simiduia agarivorans (strain DSM 21679 / JCM 13881 / BCRC 17597 / SA1) TaxID=1117647 RepID=K4KM10_SIMAS|nr:adenylyltransferase/cytidyltransferase family protein [Simiduia agarivorans]AFU99118.1 nicotinate-nucleotide adenylyltransferase [Simiduia agarivorans SA1 = DSM 21679]